MKYNKTRLETMGLEPGKDLCSVRVRPDDWDRVEEFLRGDFPFLNCCSKIERGGRMECSVAEYFFNTEEPEEMERTIEGFPFKNAGVFMSLVYRTVEKGLVCLREKFEETLFNKIREKVFAVLYKKDWEKEIEEMPYHFSGKQLEKAGINIYLPEQVVIKAGIKMIERIIKNGALTIYDWNEKETGYREMVGDSFDNFEQEREYLFFAAKAKGDPVKRLSFVTSDKEYEDLYISWTILRDETDLEAEDGVKLETWTAHKGKVYNKETGRFEFPPLEKISKEEWEIVNEEMTLTEENFKQNCLWEE